MSLISDFEWEAMAELAREKREQRLLAGDHNVPGFPAAETDLQGETFDLDDVQRAWMTIWGDQQDAAITTAHHADNTDKFDLNPSRFEPLVSRIMAAVHSKANLLASRGHDNEGRTDWGHHYGSDAQGYNLATLHGGILGVLAGRMVHTNENFLYGVGPVDIGKWLRTIDAQSTTCSLNRCSYTQAQGGLTPGPNSLVLTARGQWLLAIPLCFGCLAYIQGGSS